MDTFFDDFIKIDTSNHSENDTVNSVLKLVEGAKIINEAKTNGG